MIKPNQIRAACALIGWSGADLEKASGVSAQNLSNAASGRYTLKPESVEAIERALMAAGVEFTPNGVELANRLSYYHEGDNWYLDLLADVSMTLGGAGEVLIENVDDSKSSAAVNAKLREMRAGGIGFRMTTKTGNTHLAAPSALYRFIPEKYFKNWIVMMFGDKTAISVAGESRCLVIRDAGATEALRNRFDLVWDMLPELKIKTTAKDLI